MKIFYISNQPPGNGGAATEAYETIKRLRDAGHKVSGLFILDQKEFSLVDPDGIGDVTACGWYDRKKPILPGYDIYLGKNWSGAIALKAIERRPRVYITASVDCFTRGGLPFTQFDSAPQETSYDMQAFDSVDYVISHSTIDMIYWENFLTEQRLKKLIGMVYTPNIAVPPIDTSKLIPYRERKYDLLFSASDWKRRMKNEPLMRKICDYFKNKYRVVVFGENVSIDGVETPGRISHQEMLNALANSRVVVIPSFYDPSPNLYPESIFSGCNVMLSINVGNADFHPPDLISYDLEYESFRSRIEYALTLDHQLTYRTYTAEQATNQLIETLKTIIVKHKEKRHGIR
jgi:hypothetical protein